MENSYFYGVSQSVLAAPIIAALAAVIFYSRKRLITRYLEKNIKQAIFDSEKRLNCFDKFVFRICFNHELKTGTLKFASPLNAAIFLTIFPPYLRSGGKSHSINFDEMVGVARVASKHVLYRKYLVEKSVYDCFEMNDSNLESTILHYSQLDIRGQNEDGVRNLKSRLNASVKSKITYFTVTGQISDVSIDTLKCEQGNIKNIDVFITSPMILSHNSIKNLMIEYSCNDDVIDMSYQFLKDKKLDLVRRAIKILDSISKIHDTFKHLGSSLSIYCFKEKNPRVKLIIIENSYAQFKLGGMAYPNNMYRFGFNITDIDVVKQLSGYAKSIINSERVEKIDFGGTGLEGIKMRAIKEMVHFLIANNYKKKDITDATRDMLDVLKTESSINIFDILLKEFDVSYNSMLFSTTHVPKLIEENQRKKRKYASDFVLGKGDTHITVAMLFLRQDSILLIKKRKGHYKDKWSIVAGHVDCGESPKSAVKREVIEETGLDIKSFSLIKYFNCVDGDICKEGATLHSWYVYICHEKFHDADIIISTDEIIERQWVSFKDMNKYEMTETSKKVLQQFNFG